MTTAIARPRAIMAGRVTFTAAGVTEVSRPMIRRVVMRIDF